jgi:hypothetical protein
MGRIYDFFTNLEHEDLHRDESFHAAGQTAVDTERVIGK